MPCFNTFSRVLRKRDPPSREYKDPTPIAILIGSSVRIGRLRNEHSEDEEAAGAVPPAPIPHPRDNLPTAVMSILRYHLKRAS